MTPEQLEHTIYARFAAPYGDRITPALAQQLTICARQAARDIQPAIEAEVNRRLSRAIDTLEGRTARTVRVMPREGAA